jgi:hypothetical protein
LRNLLPFNASRASIAPLPPTLEGPAPSAPWHSSSTPNQQPLAASPALLGCSRSGHLNHGFRWDLGRHGGRPSKSGFNRTSAPHPGGRCSVCAVAFFQHPKPAIPRRESSPAWMPTIWIIRGSNAFSRFNFSR